MSGFARGKHTCTCTYCKLKFKGHERAVACPTCAIMTLEAELRESERLRKSWEAQCKGLFVDISAERRLAGRYQRQLESLGFCTRCMQAMEHDINEPFSHCGCGSAEDYGRRPLQAFQILKAQRAVDGLWAARQDKSKGKAT